MFVCFGGFNINEKSNHPTFVFLYKEKKLFLFGRFVRWRAIHLNVELKLKHQSLNLIAVSVFHDLFVQPLSVI